MIRKSKSADQLKSNKEGLNIFLMLNQESGKKSFSILEDSADHY